MVDSEGSNERIDFAKEIHSSVVGICTAVMIRAQMTLPFRVHAFVIDGENAVVSRGGRKSGQYDESIEASVRESFEAWDRNIESWEAIEDHRKGDTQEDYQRLFHFIYPPTGDTDESQVTLMASKPYGGSGASFLVILEFRNQVLQKLCGVPRVPPFLYSLLKVSIDTILESIQRSNNRFPVSESKRLVNEIFVEASATEFARLLEMDSPAYAEVQALNEVVNTGYERKAPQGTLLFLAASENREFWEIVFDEPIDFVGGEDTRTARKLLEVSKNNALLPVIRNGTFVGICRVADVPEDVNGIRVTVTGTQVWDVIDAHNTIRFRMYKGGARLLVPEYWTQKLVRLATHLFPGITKEQLEKLSVLFTEVMSLDHGSTIIVSANAIKEVERLSGAGFPLAKPVPTEHSSALSDIDGALLYDLDADLFAFGVILDGKAVPQGNRARGSRYNSAVRYISERQSVTNRAIAIVVSDDGPIDILPPSYKHVDLAEFNRNLQLVTTNSGKGWTDERLAALSWLNRYRYATSVKAADSINDVVASEPLDHGQLLFYPDIDLARFVGNPFSWSAFL